MPDERPENLSETVTTLFSALSQSNRRFLLYYLRDRGTATVGELATVVAGWKQAREADPEMVTPEDRKRVLVSLHHADLPRLKDAGLVRYDPDSRTVTLEAFPEVADAILEKSLAYERLTDSTAAENDPDPKESNEK